MGGLLENRRYQLGYGVLDRRSIAYSAARLTQEQGGRSSLGGRARSLTERTARRLDLNPRPRTRCNKPEDIEAVADDLAERWGNSTGSSTPSPSPLRSPGATSSPQSGLRRHGPPDLGLL